MVGIFLGLTNTVRAADELVRPMIFSARYTFPDKCKYITVHSLSHVQGKVYAQSGVGWILASEQGWRILTPSHVVAGADLMIGECMDHYFPLSVQSKSETLDLALLRSSQDIGSFVFPLMLLKDREAVLSKLADNREMVSLLNPDHFAQPLEQKIKSQVYSYYDAPMPGAENKPELFKSYDRDVIMTGQTHFSSGLRSLVSETLAIRPGFSGAPLFVQVPSMDPNDPRLRTNKMFLMTMMVPDSYYQPYLAGMLTESEINGSRALGISLPDILKALPLLLQSQNPVADVYVEAQHLPLRLVYRNIVSGNTLLRTQSLLSSVPGAPARLTEVCEDSLAESSEWFKVNADSAAAQVLFQKSSDVRTTDKPNTTAAPEVSPTLKEILRNKNQRSIQQKTGGGDYGEGGGSVANLRNSVLMSPDDSDVMHGYNLTSYKRPNTCHRAVLEDDAHHVYDSFLVNGKPAKATDLSEAFDDLMQSSSSGVIPAGASCQSLELRMGRETFTYYTVDNQDYRYLRHEGLAVPLNGNAQDFVQCLDDAGMKRRVHVTAKNFNIDAILGDVRNVSGTISLADSPQCQLTLTSKNYSMANHWRHQIRSPLVDVDLIFGTEDRLLSVKVLKAAPECVDKFWLTEFNYSSQEAFDNKFGKMSINRLELELSR